MKRLLLVLASVVLFGITKAQLSGVVTVPGTYTSIAAAVNDLNLQGVNGALTVNIASGYTETAPLGGYVLTASGTSVNTITFRKNGVGANPLVSAFVGTATPATAIQDGVWSLIGSDYVTFDGIDITDPNTTNPGTMEYGYGLFRADGTNGAQNNTIRNCVITLNRTNNAAGILPATDGSRGINVVNSTYTAQTTAEIITAVAGANSNNRFYNNVINNTNIGIAMIGFNDIVPYTFADYGNDVGGTSAATSNTIINFGGGGTTASAGVRTQFQYDVNVSYNIVNNNNGTGVNHTGIIRGIYLFTANGANASINNNTVTIQRGATTNQISYIENTSGSLANNNAISINNNLLANSTSTFVNTAATYGIWNTASSASLSISNNTFTNNVTRASSGIHYIFYNTGAVTSLINMNNNLTSYAHDGAIANTGAVWSVYSTAGFNSTLNMNNNSFGSYTWQNSTATGVLYFVYAAGSPSVLNVNNNNISNLTLNHSGTEYYIYNLASPQNSMSVVSNTITNITRTAANGVTWHIYNSNGGLATASQTIANNIVSNITGTVSGTGSCYPFFISGGASPFPKKTIFNNIATNINVNTSGLFYGMFVNSIGEGPTTTGSEIYNNAVTSVTTTGTSWGIFLSTSSSPNVLNSAYNNTVSALRTNGITSPVYGANVACGTGGGGVIFRNNKIFDLTASGATGSAFGINATTSFRSDIFNNLVGNINAPAASGIDRVNGIYVISGNNVRLFFNSVHLNASSTGLNFGTNAIWASTTATLNMQNNLLFNNSVPAGTGLTAAYRRNGTILTTYNPASNNNLFYAGVPTASNVIFADGTNTYSTLALYQATVTPADAISVTENPTFISTVGSNPNFLNINAVTPTLIESGGTAVAGITTDYVYTTRNPGTPDIGAWEGNFTAALTCSGTPSAGTATINTSQGCPSTAFIVSTTGQSSGAGITYQWQSAPSASGPWTNITGANGSSHQTSVTVSTFYRIIVTCTNSAQSATSAVVSYSVVNPGPCICSNYPNSSAQFTGDEEIFGVSFGTLNNSSTCTSVGPGPNSVLSLYSNYAGFVAPPTVLQGQSVPFTVTVGTCGGNFDSGVSIWIDYNQNGSFSDPGEQAFLSAASINGPYIASGLITIPATASVGITRMRVVNMETTVMSSILPTGLYGYGETEDYCVDIQAPLACTGTPNNGVAAINTPSGCPNVNLSITSSSVTNALGITYQWFSAPSATGPWTAIPSATNITYTTTVANTTYFQMVTTCSNSALSATTNVVDYQVVNPGPCVCGQYGPSSATNISDEEIIGVQFGSLNNPSTCTTTAPGPGSINQRYSNYAGFLAAPTVLQGQNVPFTVNVGTCGGNFDSGIKIFIDYNQNGSFADPGEEVYVSPASTNGPFIATGNILIPMTASVGVTRMRVVNVETTLPSAITPTGTYGWGETEDYCIDIQTPLPCSGAPASGTAAISTATGCVTDIFNLSATGVTNGLGISYQWQSAPSATGPWAPVATATNLAFSTTASVTTFFQLVTTCSVSALSATSSIVSYTPQNCYLMSNGTISACGGTLYDTGGPNNNYLNNENYTLTIVPATPGASVQLAFSSFAVETCCDYLQIYDGANTAAPLIGQYTALPPNITASNPAGVLTLRFFTDGSVVQTGFAAAITCTSACAGPPTAPTSTGVSICSGNSATLASSSSTAGTIQWYSSATSTNYIAQGTVFVTPVLNTSTTYYVKDSTACGISPATAVNVTVITTPTLNAVTTATTLCSGNSATLTASGMDTYTWSTSSNSAVIIVTPSVTSSYTVVGTSTACNVTQNQILTINVNQTPTVSLSAAVSTICVLNGSISLNGQPSGGVYSGVAVTGSLLSIANAGTFTPMYSYTNTLTGCSNTATTQVIVANCTGVDEAGYSTNGIRVYPNPNSGSFMIETSNVIEKTIEVMDVTGRVVISEKSDSNRILMNISNLANGMYQVRIVSEKGVDMIKVIKQ